MSLQSPNGHKSFWLEGTTPSPSALGMFRQTGRFALPSVLDLSTRPSSFIPLLPRVEEQHRRLLARAAELTERQQHVRHVYDAVCGRVAAGRTVGAKPAKNLEKI